MRGFSRLWFTGGGERYGAEVGVRPARFTCVPAVEDRYVMPHSTIMQKVHVTMRLSNYVMLYMDL
jgi:hypothetical protein